MNISVFIETHIYSEEKLQDQYFDTPDNSGVLLPDDFAILLFYRGRCIELEYNESTTIRYLCEKVIGEMLRETNTLNHFDTKRYSISNYDANLSELLKKYLDPQNTGSIRVSFLACADAGEVLAQKNLRYIMHSREGNKHNNPHVHVRDIHTRQEASISILDDFCVLAGSLPKKELKAARHTIKEKQEFFIESWNTLTDGLNIDINHALHLIDY